MRKERNNKKKEIRLNLDFIDFIKNIKESKIEVVESNKESIEKVYNEIVNLKFSNIERIYYRNNRKEVVEMRNKILGEMGVDIKEYLKLGEKIVDMSKERSNRYISIRY